MSPERYPEHKEELKVILTHRAVIQNGNSILLIQRNDITSYKPSHWELPGGKFSPYEDPTVGLNREVFEETGLIIETLQEPLITSCSKHESGKFAGQTYVTFSSLCQLTDNPRVVLSDEHQAHTWVSINELYNYELTPESKSAIEALTNSTSHQTTSPEVQS